MNDDAKKKARAEQAASLNRFLEAEAKNIDAPAFHALVEFISGVVKVEAGGDTYTFPRPNLAMLALWTLRFPDFGGSIMGAARLAYAVKVQRDPDKMRELFQGKWPADDVITEAVDVDGLDSFGYLFAWRAVVDFINETAKKKAREVAAVASEASPQQ